MSTFENPIEQQELLKLCMKAGLTDPYGAAAIVEWSKVPYSKLIGRPDLEQQKKHYEAREQALRENPTVQKAIQPAPSPTLSPKKHQSAAVVQDMIRRGWSNDTMTGQAPQQRSHTYGQQAQPVQRGGYVYYDATPNHRLSQQLTAPAGAYLNEPQMTVKAEVQQIQGALEQVKRNLEALARRFQKPKVKPQTEAQKLAAKLTKLAQVRRSGAIQPKKAAVQQPAPAPALPISPFTGQPSSITAAVRATTMGEPNPTLGQHPYQVQQAIEAQALQQRAAYDNSLPISPFTGQPSSIRAAILKTT
jgi:hypothetical protein